MLCDGARLVWRNSDSQIFVYFLSGISISCYYYTAKGKNTSGKAALRKALFFRYHIIVKNSRYSEECLLLYGF